MKKKHYDGCKVRPLKWQGEVYYYCAVHRIGFDEMLKEKLLRCVMLQTDIPLSEILARYGGR